MNAVPCWTGLFSKMPSQFGAFTNSFKWLFYFIADNPTEICSVQSGFFLLEFWLETSGKLALIPARFIAQSLVFFPAYSLMHIRSSTFTFGIRYLYLENQLLEIIIQNMQSSIENKTFDWRNTCYSSSHHAPSQTVCKANGIASNTNTTTAIRILILCSAAHRSTGTSGCKKNLHAAFLNDSTSKEQENIIESYFSIIFII